MICCQVAGRRVNEAPVADPFLPPVRRGPVRPAVRTFSDVRALRNTVPGHSPAEQLPGGPATVARPASRPATGESIPARRRPSVSGAAGVAAHPQDGSSTMSPGPPDGRKIRSGDAGGFRVGSTCPLLRLRVGRRETGPLQPAENSHLPAGPNGPPARGCLFPGHRPPPPVGSDRVHRAVPLRSGAAGSTGSGAPRRVPVSAAAGKGGSPARDLEAGRPGGPAESGPAIHRPVLPFRCLAVELSAACAWII